MTYCRRLSLGLFSVWALGAACSSSPSTPIPQPDGSADADPALYCSRGQSVIGVQPPEGFCLKHFAQIGEARTLVLAPNGDLFVGAPSRATSGGATGGPGAVMVLSDDDHDGVAEEHTFVDNVADVHGVALGGGFLYYTTQTAVWRTPYVDGQRAATAAAESLGLPTTFGDGGRWTHGLARSVAGELVTSRGEYGSCGSSQGGVVGIIQPDGSLQGLARQLRNPMYLRCHPTADVCAAAELGEDQRTGAHEKLILLRPDTNYGFPCCFTTGDPMTPACAGVTKEDASFPLADTPFGFDWERELWPAPYRGALFVALHGSAYSSPQWQGARIVFARTDPTTHAPNEDWQPFLGGFGPGGSKLERPSDVVFSPDGRLFFSDDHGGRVFWMAPTSLVAPN